MLVDQTGGLERPRSLERGEVGEALLVVEVELRVAVLSHVLVHDLLLPLLLPLLCSLGFAVRETSRNGCIVSFSWQVLIASLFFKQSGIVKFVEVSFELETRSPVDLVEL